VINSVTALLIGVESALHMVGLAISIGMVSLAFGMVGLSFYMVGLALTWSAKLSIGMVAPFLHVANCLLF
jgi:hypothetical protein